MEVIIAIIVLVVIALGLGWIVTNEVSFEANSMRVLESR